MYGNDRAVYRFETPFGFPVEIRQSIVMLAMFYLLFSARSVATAIDALIMVAMILTAIFLHEMGHAWGSIVQGWSEWCFPCCGGLRFCFCF